MRSRNKRMLLTILKWIVIIVVTCLIVKFIFVPGSFDDFKDSMSGLLDKISINKGDSSNRVSFPSSAMDCQTLKNFASIGGESKSSMARLSCGIECPTNYYYSSYSCDGNKLICNCRK